MIQDEIQTLDRKTSFRWGMVTRADVRIEGRKATLQQGDKQLLLSVIAPGQTGLELFEIETPPQEYDAPNKGTRMIGFQVVCSPSTRSTLTVLLIPGGAVEELPEIRPLAEW